MSQTAPIKIRIDTHAVREIEKDLAHIKNGSNRAMSNAINHTLGVTRTEASKEIRKQVNLKAGYVREKLRIRRANISRVQGAIQTPKSGQSLSRFWVQDGQKNVFDFNKVSLWNAPKVSDAGPLVKIKPRGQKKRMPGAFFIGPMANGAILMVRRTNYGRGLGRSGGLKFYHGPSVSQVFTDVKDDLQAPSGNRLMQRLSHEAERLLKRQ